MTLRIFADDIEAFLVVSRHLSFSRAAQELFLTPQAVSARIQRLERRLGFTLFHRTTRTVERTPEAEMLLVGIGSATRYLDEAITAVAQYRRHVDPRPEAVPGVADHPSAAVVRRADPVVVIGHEPEEPRRISA